MEASGISGSVSTASIMDGGAEDLFMYELLQNQALLPDVISELPAPDVPFPNAALPQAQQVRAMRLPCFVAAAHRYPPDTSPLAPAASSLPPASMITRTLTQAAAQYHTSRATRLLTIVFSRLSADICSQVACAGASARHGLPVQHAAPQHTGP
jgi:hypothetical protein